jgi:hypothetical protein
VFTAVLLTLLLQTRLQSPEHCRVIASRVEAEETAFCDSTLRVARLAALFCAGRGSRYGDAK